MSALHLSWQRIGLGCLYAWIFIVVSHMGSFANPEVFTYDGPMLRMGFSGSLTFFLILGSFAVKVWRSLNYRFILAAVASGISFFGTALFCIASIAVHNEFLLISGMALTGMGNAVLMLSWGDYFTRIHTDEMSLHIVVSFCFASLVTALIVVVGVTVLSVAVVLVLPLLSGLIYCKVSMGVSESLAPRREATGVFFWKMVVALLFVGLVYGFVRALGPWVAAVQANECGVVFLEIISFAFVAIASVVLMRGPHVVRLYRLAFFLTIGGCIFALAIVGEVRWVPISVIIAGQFLFQALIWLINPEVVIRFAPNHSISIFGWTTAVLHGGMFLGAAVALLIPVNIGWGIFWASIALFAFGLQALLLFVFREGDIAEAACSRDTGITLPSVGVSLEAIDAISLQCRLTSREREVMMLLSQGRTIPYIADSLCIAPSTVKTHVKHIYEKTGVGDRQELIDSVQRLGR